MTGFFVRKVAGALPTLFGVVTVVFFLLHLIPGDPVDMMLGEAALPAQREELRAHLHLDEGVSKQFVRYVAGIVRGDLGRSMISGEPVTVRLSRALPRTLQLAFTALMIALLIALPAGLFAAAKRGTWLDTTVMTASLIGLSLPAFWLGPLLMLLFAYFLGWLPISGAEEPLSVVLPALTLGSGMAALLARMTRTTVSDLLQEPFVRTARAKGLSPWGVWVKHLLRNALLPIVTIVALQAGALLAGSIITEKVFSWPGIGLELTDAIERRDYPVVQGVVLVVAISYILIHLFTELLYGWIDPRTRSEVRQ